MLKGPSLDYKNQYNEAFKCRFTTPPIAIQYATCSGTHPSQLTTEEASSQNEKEIRQE